MEHFKAFDADGHVLEKEEMLEQHYEGSWSNSKRFDGLGIFPSLDGWPRTVAVKQGDPGPRYLETDGPIWSKILDDMNLEGSVLFPSSGLGVGLIKNAEFASATATAYNNWLEATYINHDIRLYGTGLMGLHDIAGAITELERCSKSRTRFVSMLLPTVTCLGKSYGHKDFWPLFEKAEKLGMVLALHGAPSEGFGLDHLDEFQKVHTLSHPIPMFIQLTDMIFSGVFEEFPKLRFAFLEAGCSWVPFMMDRLDYEFDSVFGAKVRNRLTKKPSDIIRNHESFWVSCEMGEVGLKYALDAIGSDRILYASDFPHEPTEEDLTSDLPMFLSNDTYSDEIKRKIAGKNAKTLYGIK